MVHFDRLKKSHGKEFPSWVQTKLSTLHQSKFPPKTTSEETVPTGGSLKVEVNKGEVDQADPSPEEAKKGAEEDDGQVEREASIMKDGTPNDECAK